MIVNFIQVDAINAFTHRIQWYCFVIRAKNLLFLHEKLLIDYTTQFKCEKKHS